MKKIVFCKSTTEELTRVTGDQFNTFMLAFPIIWAFWYGNEYVSNQIGIVSKLLASAMMIIEGVVLGALLALIVSLLNVLVNIASQNYFSKNNNIMIAIWLVICFVLMMM